MAINKKLIHFKSFSDFNSKKLSANEENTQYTLGVDGEVTTGSPEILYQSIVWIKDTKQQWTHGQLYGVDEDLYIKKVEDPDVEIEAFMINRGAFLEDMSDESQNYVVIQPNSGTQEGIRTDLNIATAGIQFTNVDGVTLSATSSSELNYGDNVISFEGHTHDYAPKSHASTAATYGVASATQYGHMKVGDGLVSNNGVVSVQIGAGLEPASDSDTTITVAYGDFLDIDAYQRLTVKTGTTNSTVAVGNHTHSEFVTDDSLNETLTDFSKTNHTHTEFTTLQTNIDSKVSNSTYNSKISEVEGRIDTLENKHKSAHKVLWVGTSIPAGDIQHGDEGTTDLGSNNYPKMIADELGFTLYNNARGSSFVCFYPAEEDGTSAWADASDWSEYSDEVWKGYSLSASHAQIEEKFSALNVPDWLIASFKRYSYETLIIPYIDGTIASCDTVIIDHGYNDRQPIINEASWHPGDGETQFSYGSGRDWLLTLQDPFESTQTTEGYFQGKWWNDESVDSKKHYMSAMIFLAKKIWAINPKIKIIIGNYFTKKSNVFASEFGNDRLGEFICLTNQAIANWLQVQCVNIANYTGLYNRNLTAGNDYALFCPDGVHPHSDTTGHSNKIIAGVYINNLRGIL